jgi:hypothetical protein
MLYVELNRAVEKFGIPQFRHSHDTLIASMYLNTPECMCWQSIWNQVSQLSQQIDGRLGSRFAAFYNVPQGHLGALGPGFVSVSKAFANNIINMYLLTGLLAIYFQLAHNYPCCLG